MEKIVPLVRPGATVSVPSRGGTAVFHALDRPAKHLPIGLRHGRHQRHHVGHPWALAWARLQAVLHEPCDVGLVNRAYHLIHADDVRRIADPTADLETEILNYFN